MPTEQQQVRLTSRTSIPDKIDGRYVVKDLLGEGGFGAVYRAWDELEERDVALKLIRAEVGDAEGGSGSGAGSSRGASRGSSSGRASRSSRRRGVASEVPSRFHTPARRAITRAFGTSGSQGSDLAEAFKDEFRLLTQLHHPNLASVYDFGRCQELDAFFFTQELVEGTYLTEFLAGKPREAVVDVFVQLARALDYIHALGLVHEDIKPTNVLVTITPEGSARAKLIDFGLARVLRGETPAELADDEERTVLGTPGFSAPEKIRGQDTDSRSDLYSLAATIYASTRGQRPFPSKSFTEALRAQLDWRPELAGALLPSCGPVIAEIVGRMLQPDPELRPQSARSVVLELLRRETSHTDRQESQTERQEFAQVLVEHLPFVDRAGYLDLLITRASDVLLARQDEADSASRSQSRARLIRSVVVEAPEGMGKRRLMSELRREIQLGGGLFVHGGLWSSDASALGPFAAIVQQVASSLGDRSEVSRRYAGLIKLARDEPNAEDAFASQLNEFLLAASLVRPFAMHLSQLAQATSEHTRFEQLCRAIDHSDARILLCVTTTSHRKLSPLLAALSRDQVLEQWNLRPFTAREMRSVLAGVFGDIDVIPDLVSMLDKLTGGHPLSFRETLRVLIEEGILVRDGDTWVLRGASAAAEALHQSLAERSESRLDSLGVSAWEIASILYLLEAPILESTLADLSDLRRERFRRSLDRLEAEGLIVRSAESGQSRVALAHESVREAIRRRHVDSLDETRLDVAARIEELETDEPQMLYLRARLLDDASERLESLDGLDEAAAALFEAGQPRLGALVIERAIERLRRYGGVDGLKRLLRTQLRLLRRGAGSLDDPRRELSHWESGVLIAQVLNDPRAESMFRLALCDRSHADMEADVDRTLERLVRAAAAARRGQDKTLELKIACRRAEVLLGMGDIEQAGAFSRQAMAIMELEGAEPTDIVHIVGVRLRCLSLSGQLGEGRKLHHRAKAIAANVPVVQRSSYLSGIAFLGALGHDPGRSIPEMKQSIEELRAANLQRMLILPLHNLGDLQLRDEDIDAAAESFAEALRLSQIYGMDSNVHLNRGFLGYAMARLGELDGGAELLAEAKAAMQQIPGEQILWQQLRLLDAEVAHMRGQSARARRELEEMLAEFQSSSELSLAHWAQDALARIEQDLETTFIEAPQPVYESTPDEDTVRTKPIT
jgi:serine/threonine protein kinase/DNA-binding MarR family transcriptional regulator